MEMHIGLKEEDRQLIMNVVTTFKKIGEDLNRNLERINKNLESKKK